MSMHSGQESTINVQSDWVLHTLDEVAARLQVSVRTVRRRIRAGEIEYVDLGARSLRVPPEALAAYIERQTRPAKPVGPTAQPAPIAARVIRLPRHSSPEATRSGGGRRGKRGPRIRGMPAAHP